MTMKMHILFSHQDRFPDNLGAVSDEQGERFQDISVMEERYPGRWYDVMMADYCCSIKRENLQRRTLVSPRNAKNASCCPLLRASFSYKINVILKCEITNVLIVP